MNADQRLEWEVMEYIDKWMANRERPDNEAPFIFPDILQDIPQFAKTHVSNATLEDRLFQKLHEMKAANLITGDIWHNAGGCSLTREGYACLEQYRNSRGMRLILSKLQAIADKALTSIITPIVVSVLTVLALQYLGLKE